METLDNGLVSVGGVFFPSVEAAQDVGYGVPRLKESVQDSGLASMANNVKDVYRTAKERGEHISLPELKHLARNLRNAGAEVPPYSRIPSAQLYRILERITEDILD